MAEGDGRAASPPLRATFSLAADEFGRAAQLHARGQLLRRPAIVVNLAILAVLTALQWSSSPGDIRGLAFVLGCGLAGGVGAGLAWLLLVVPRQARRRFGRNRLLRIAVSIEADASAVRFASETGTGTVPWTDMPHRREDARVLLLYASDRLYYVVPKRALPPGMGEAMRGWQAAGRAERRSNPGDGEARGLAALFAEGPAGGRGVAGGADDEAPLAVSGTWITTRADLVAAQRLFYRWHWRRPRTLVGPLLIVLVVGAAAAAPGLDAPTIAGLPLGFDAKAALGAAAFIVGGRALVYAGMPFLMRDFRRRQPDLAYPWRVELDRIGVRAVMPHRDVRIAWSDYVAYAQDAQVLLVYQSDAMFQLVPTHAVDAAFLDAFRELRGNLPRR